MTAALPTVLLLLLLLPLLLPLLLLLLLVLLLILCTLTSIPPPPPPFLQLVADADAEGSMFKTASRESIMWSGGLSSRVLLLQVQ